MNIKHLIIGILLAIVAALGGVTVGTKNFGNSQEGQYATSTDSTWNTPAATLGGTKLIKSGPGTLGSVIITNETTGSFNIYDATSTNHGDYATTTIAKVYASLAEGTYIFNVDFKRGLLIEFQSPSVASSTITWR